MKAWPPLPGECYFIHPPARLFTAGDFNEGAVMMPDGGGWGGYKPESRELEGEAGAGREDPVRVSVFSSVKVRG